MSSGYYRFPTICCTDRIAFVSEDDLWEVPAQGGLARRLTTTRGAATYPMYDPTGTWLAFVGFEEGQPDVYVMPAEGGEAHRLTYLASDCRILGWDPAGTHILFTSNYGQPHRSLYEIYRVAVDTPNGQVERLPYGPARSIAFGPGDRVVLGRNTGDPARWKRYRGGTAGQLWIDLEGNGSFQRFLAELQGNIASPMWIWDPEKPEDLGRIYFISDHEGIGNLYSARPDGSDLRRHTDHEDYYARNPSTDGTRIVYHAGADLYLYHIQEERVEQVQVDYRSPRVQRMRRFVSPGRYMDGAHLNPKGTRLVVTTRGKLYAFGNHEGPVLQLGKRDGVRYRLAAYLNDGRRIVTVSDEPGEEVLEIHSIEPGVPPRRLDRVAFGRAVDLVVCPTADKVALTNHRHELLVVDLETQEVIQVDRSPWRRIAGVDWSPDGRWLAYGFSATLQTTEIRLYRLPEPQAEDPELRQGKRVVATRPVLHDVRPAFDPEGRFLYFISYREFNPVYDSLHFDLGFPRGARPYLLLLQADQPNPFVPQPDGTEPPKVTEEDAPDEEDGDDVEEDVGPEEEEDAEEEGDEYSEEDPDEGLSDPGEEGERPEGARDGDPRHAGRPSSSPSEEPDAERTAQEVSESAEPTSGEGKGARRISRLRIDLEGMENRVLAFPVPEGRYGQILGISGKALFTLFPIKGTLPGEDDEEEEEVGGLLRMWHFGEFKADTLAHNVSWIQLSRNRKKLLYGSDHGLRVIKAGEKPTNSGPPRRTGWIELDRVKVSVDPQSEWEQMFREAWRLQRDHFWTEDMSQVDWRLVYERYFPLIRRVSCRSEFSDLMWEMQGELGTSHAYEFGGDYRPRPRYDQGFLGAELAWDGEVGGYRIRDYIAGDPWDPEAHSPLAAPGVDVQVGDVIVAVNGQPVSREVSPPQLLVNLAGQEVQLTLVRPGEGSEAAVDSEASSPTYRVVTVRTLRSELPARYRAWVNANREQVHRATGGRVGYVHIPDMGPRGFAEFHRGYLAEIDKDALIVDVRFNGGGHVSALILEKLARRRLGYDVQRWGGIAPYPPESVAGPLVALTNEYAGSDGDIFCHSFKLLGLGPLIGKRTWGGVIGIWPRHALVDGTVTTQPEFSFWFQDVGWNVENYGTDPDIEVDITPQDHQAGRDTQLERAIQEILRLLEEKPPLRPPDLRTRPSRALPKLPPRPGEKR